MTAKNVAAGHIRVNKLKVCKPSYSVSAGDVLTIFDGQNVLVVRVMGLVDRRQSPSDALTLYEVISHSRPLKEESQASYGGFGAAQLAGI